MELWAFDAGDMQFVLRRYRNGKPHEGAEDKFPIASEAKIIQQAGAAGIKAPKVVGTLEVDDDLGPGYVMSRLEGESLPTRLFRNPQYTDALTKLTAQFGQELAKIHSTAIDPDLLETKPPETLLEKVESVYKQAGYLSPIIAMTLNWLQENLPSAETDTCLVHGDFRMGNVLVTEEGLSAVLDWELAHFGLPEEDLAWLCMPSWRFGRYDKTAGGVGSVEELISAYEAAGGRPIDRGVFDWFLVYASLSWGASTVIMAHWWRGGDDRSLERILVGTRISEVEIDLLLLLEQIAGIDLTIDIDLGSLKPTKPEGDVLASELNEAAIEYLMSQVVPETNGAAKFHARIAANALSISQRMIELGPNFAHRAEQRRQNLGISTETLSEELRGGNRDWKQAELLSHLRLSCLERLAMHQPKYAAINAALKKWRKS